MPCTKKCFLLVTTALCVAGVLLVKVMWFGSMFSGEKSHDFGLISIERPKTVLSYTFVLTNRSGENLVLHDVIHACGCTTTEEYQDVVLDGEEFILPVQLTLRQSQIRKSTIRLLFENGAIEVLSLKVEGRLIQPLQVSPVPIVLIPEEGDANAIIGMERFDEGSPSTPEFILPEGVTIEAGTWQRKRKGSSWEKVPAKWMLQLSLRTEKTLPSDSQFTVVVDDHRIIAPLSSEPKKTENVPFTSVPSRKDK